MWQSICTGSRNHFLFVVAFLLGPWEQLSGLTMMPGNLGDARLVNYFLENVYQFLKGDSASLWSLGFFYPYPYVGGLSENLFGSSPVYAALRLFRDSPYTCFQFWYLFGFITNYFAAHYALKSLGATNPGATIGALIFTFALPVSGHSGHPQLHYRFGVPLSMSMLVLFLNQRRFCYFVASLAWLVWQFYCSIYIGFFTLLALAVLLACHLYLSTFGSEREIKEQVKNFYKSCAFTRPKNGLPIYSLLVLAVLTIALFYPYFRVAQLYGGSRTLSEIIPMLPRLQSYLLSDASWLWASQSRIFDNLPYRHEHQMFVGLAPLLLVIYGAIAGSRAGLARYPCISLSLPVLVLLTLYMGGLSIWFLLAQLPVASAIRAITRIDLIMLFHVSYLSANGVDAFLNQFKFGARLIYIVLVPFMVFEFAAVTPPLSYKSDWIAESSSTEEILHAVHTEKPVIFLSQNIKAFYITEINAMWYALTHSQRTINGYSGSYPPGYALQYGRDCSELPKRILSFLAFNHQSGDQMRYRNLMNEVEPVGFFGCDKEWFETPPQISETDHIYSPNEILQLEPRLVDRIPVDDGLLVIVKLANHGEHDIACKSSIGKPVRLSWRLLNQAGNPVTNWDTRQDLPFDVKAKSAINVSFHVVPPNGVQVQALEVSLVQEAVFWSHDLGMHPLVIPWN